jgi:hypothetical protein
MPEPRRGADTVPATPRGRPLLAWSLWALTFGCCAAGLAVTVVLVRPLSVGLLAQGAVRALVYPLGYATVGLVLTLRRPANPIGWLYAAAGLMWSLSIPGDAWVDQLVAEHRALPPAAQLSAVFGEFNWAPATVLGVILPALLVPDGRLRSRRWRPVAAAAVAVGVLVLVGSALAPVELEDNGIPNPFALAGPAGDLADAVGGLSTLLWLVILVVSLACVVLRFRSSTGIERQQLRWVVAGAAGAVVGLLSGALSPQRTVVSSVLYAGVLCVPVAVAVAVLRYRLWDLDRLISRTLTYTLVTALLIIPYLLIVPAAGHLAQGSGSLAVAAATLAAVALFQPLRRRIQNLVDRRFNRRRYDATRTVEHFAARLRDQIDLEALHGELLGVVQQTMQPTRASLWLRAPAAGPSAHT